MPWYEMLAVLAAGAAAGTINTVVGSGSLITFPTLLALGIAPITANVSNNIGLVPGGVSGTWGYRGELIGQGPLVRCLLPLSVLGSVLGAVLLLWLPSRAFDAIVPVLLVLAVLLVLLQPQLQRRVRSRRRANGSGHSPGERALLLAGTFGAGTYGGYFGAAQGVLLMGLLGSLVPEPVHRLNALKNVLALGVNAAAALAFAVAAPDRIDLRVVGLIAAGSVLGGVLGARYGRRLPPQGLRALIVVIGVVAVARIVVGWS